MSLQGVKRTLMVASGAGAILVGESLVKSSDPSGQLRELGS